MNARAFLFQLDGLAADVGRLRRRFASNEAAWTGAYVADRLAQRVETLDAIVQSSASELAADGETVDMALALVDARAHHVRTLLGEKPR